MFILIVFIYFSHIIIFIVGLNSENKERNISYHYECGIPTETNSSYTLGISKATFGTWPWVAVCFIDSLHYNIKYFLKECIESSTKNTWYCSCTFLVRVLL